MAPLELLYRTIHVKDDIFYFLVGRHVTYYCRSTFVVDVFVQVLVLSEGGVSQKLIPTSPTSPLISSHISTHQNQLGVIYTPGLVPTYLVQ